MAYVEGEKLGFYNICRVRVLYIFQVCSILMKKLVFGKEVTELIIRRLPKLLVVVKLGGVFDHVLIVIWYPVIVCILSETWTKE